MDDSELERLLRYAQRVRREGTGPEVKVYRHEDGTVVRFKPQGDLYRRDVPAYTIEVLIDPASEILSLEAMAFKVDDQGKPVPKCPQDLNAELKKTDRHRNIDRFMGLAHQAMLETGEDQ